MKVLEGIKTSLEKEKPENEENNRLHEKKHRVRKLFDEIINKHKHHGLKRCCEILMEHITEVEEILYATEMITNLLEMMEMEL